MLALSSTPCLAVRLQLIMSHKELGLGGLALFCVQRMGGNAEFILNIVRSDINTIGKSGEWTYYAKVDCSKRISILIEIDSSDFRWSFRKFLEICPSHHNPTQSAYSEIWIWRFLLESRQILIKSRKQISLTRYLFFTAQVSAIKLQAMRIAAWDKRTTDPPMPRLAKVAILLWLFGCLIGIRTQGPSSYRACKQYEVQLNPEIIAAAGENFGWVSCLDLNKNRIHFPVRKGSWKFGGLSHLNPRSQFQTIWRRIFGIAWLNQSVFHLVAPQKLAAPYKVWSSFIPYCF